MGAGAVLSARNQAFVHFAEPAIIHFEPQSEDCGMAVLFGRAEEANLPGSGIGEVELVH